MRILVFEYITGGGLNGTIIPDKLAREGQMMRDALLYDLSKINGMDITLLCDSRMPDLTELMISNPKLKVLKIEPVEDCREVWLQALKCVDAAWPIAPETDQILAGLCRDVELANKILLTSGSGAVLLAGDKLKTYQLLSLYGLDMVQTIALSDFEYTNQQPWIIKPLDGVGCDQIQVFHSTEEFQQLQKNCLPSEAWVVQPFTDGATMSLSALFGNEHVILLACNQQNITIKSGRFELTGCRVNVESRNKKRLTLMLQKIASNVPGLWGYVGIDYIENESDISLLEINPRLTTCYAGIRKALGINVVSLMLKLFEGKPKISPKFSKGVDIVLTAAPAIDIHE